MQRDRKDKNVIYKNCCNYAMIGMSFIGLYLHQADTNRIGPGLQAVPVESGFFTAFLKR